MCINTGCINTGRTTVGSQVVDTVKRLGRPITKIAYNEGSLLHHACVRAVHLGLREMVASTDLGVVQTDTLGEPMGYGRAPGPGTFGGPAGRP